MKCIRRINTCLSRHTNNTVCVCAGYLREFQRLCDDLKFYRTCDRRPELNELKILRLRELLRTERSYPKGTRSGDVIGQLRFLIAGLQGKAAVERLLKRINPRCVKVKPQPLKSKKAKARQLARLKSNLRNVRRRTTYKTRGRVGKKKKSQMKRVGKKK
jgi:hypothetical protein